MLMRAATSLPDTLDETSFTDNILRYAKLRGWKRHHDRPARVKGRNGEDEWRTAIQGDKGFPDLLLARNGRVILAELKTARGQVAPSQREWLEALAPPGKVPDVEVFVWRPKDWPDIIKVLR